MSWLLLLFVASAIVAAAAIIVFGKQKKPNRIMQEGKLVESETVWRDGEMFYVEKVAFKDWQSAFTAFIWFPTD